MGEWEDVWFVWVDGWMDGWVAGLCGQMGGWVGGWFVWVDGTRVDAWGAHVDGMDVKSVHLRASHT